MDIYSPLVNSTRQHIYEVTELNQLIKQILEDKFDFLWISGEISNLRIPSSGHCYFTLKDSHSQLNAIIFRTQRSSLKFKPEDGLTIIGLGRISVYEPRGSYQVIFEYLEPKGIGALQIAFEKLKRKLSDEGLFDVQHKLPLPVLPKKISIVTSPTGAAVQDFIKVAQRRFPNLPLEVVPVSVQGDRSPVEIERAIAMLNDRNTTDIIVLARGGGSIEDLCAFNDEQVARAIFHSKIPIVSAVGHETDFTIADFVADLRAPTPSAAAETTVPSKNELIQQIQLFNQKLYSYVSYQLKILHKTIMSLSSRLVHPRRRLEDMRLRLDEHLFRLHGLIRKSLARKRERLSFDHNMLIHVSPAKAVISKKEHVVALHHASITAIVHCLRERQTAFAGQISVLDALNPMNILRRGYSITRRLPDRTIVRSANMVKPKQTLEILLGKGQITVRVKNKVS